MRFCSVVLVGLSGEFPFCFCLSVCLRRLVLGGWVFAVSLLGFIAFVLWGPCSIGGGGGIVITRSVQVHYSIEQQVCRVIGN